MINYPNLDVGVEVFTKGTTATNPDGTVRYTDPSTSKQPAFPSARKGHTLSTFMGKVYMFGGRSSGYSCAYGYTDMLNMGSTESGRDIYPCVHYQPEVCTHLVEDNENFLINMLYWIVHTMGSYPVTQTHIMI